MSDRRGEKKKKETDNKSSGIGSNKKGGGRKSNRSGSNKKGSGKKSNGSGSKSNNRYENRPLTRLQVRLQAQNESNQSQNRGLGAHSSSRVLHEQVQNTSEPSVQQQQQHSPVAAVVAPGTQDHGMSPNDKEKVIDKADEEEKVVEVQEGQAGEEDPELVKLRDELKESENELATTKNEKMKKLLNSHIEVLKGQIAELEGRPVNGMDALSTPLPKCVFDRTGDGEPVIPTPHGSSSRSNSLNSFPHEPISVREMTKSELKRMWKTNAKTINKKNPSVKLDFGIVGNQEAGDETGVSGFLQHQLGILLKLASDSGMFPTKHLVRSGRTSALVSATDALILYYDKIVPNKRHISIIVEIKTSSLDLGDIVAGWSCAYGCNKDMCPNERHRAISPLRQLFNYMVLSGRRIGLLSTYNEWVGVIRDCHGNVIVTPVVKYDTIGDTATKVVSVAQLVVIMCLIALRTEDSPLAFQSDDDTLVPCDGEECGKHTKPRRSMDNTTGSKKTSSMGSSSTGGTTGSPGGISHMFLSDLIGVPSERNSIGASVWKGQLNNQDAIVKLLDISKPKKDDVNTLDSMQNEAKIYSRLGGLQGQCIPRLLGHGQTQEGFLYALATEPVGEPISLKHVAKLETYRERATKVLQQVHKRGVLHGDIRAPNLLIHPDGEGVFLIDFGMSEVFEPADANDDPTNRWTTRMLQEQHELDEIFDSLQEQSRCCEYKRGQDVVKKLKF